MQRGAFIVLEGGEGAGKSSAVSYAKARLPAGKFLFTREPGGTPFAETIRQLLISLAASETSPATQLGLLFAARLDHVRARIRLALARGMNVVSERFDSATYAYQIVGQEAPELKPLFFSWRKLYADCLPDTYILLDVDPARGLQRMRDNRYKPEPIDHFESRELAFHERTRAGLFEFLRDQPHVAVDANRPLLDVQKDVLRHITGISRI